MLIPDPGFPGGLLVAGFPIGILVPGFPIGIFVPGFPTGISAPGFPTPKPNPNPLWSWKNLFGSEEELLLLIYVNFLNPT